MSVEIVNTAQVAVQNDELKQEIRTQQVVECFLCRTPGEEIYRALTDRLSVSLGVWRLLRCPDCGLVWLSPRPIPADIGKAYRTYFTHTPPQRMFPKFWEKTRRALYAASIPGYNGHAEGFGWSTVGKGLSSIPTLSERALLGTMCLTGPQRGKLLDIGCGDGTFLSRMRDLGWTVTGVEPDPVAAYQVRERYGIDVKPGTLADANFSAESFNAITLSHVIEHVYDPVALIVECARLLTSSGTLVIVTPNVNSLGHRVFRNTWFALDPPRHLHLFSPETLQACLQKSEGLTVKVLRTSPRMAHWIWKTSETIRRHGAFYDSTVTWRLRLQSLRFQLQEEKQMQHDREAGEEIVLIASKTPPASLRSA
jgi:2-polyprenyl-3-methyl-5-hydroxy-6-metoxy-1,4-benzoquinol methylase